MAYPTRVDAFNNIENLDKEIALLVKELYFNISGSLSMLIQSDMVFFEAEQEMNRIFNQAVKDMNFRSAFYSDVLSTIALSSYTETISNMYLDGMSFSKFEDNLGKIFAVGRQKTVNEAIRGRTTQALEDQREIINNALRTGKTIKATADDLQKIQIKFGKTDKISKASEIPKTVINQRLFGNVATARANIEKFGYTDTIKEINKTEAYLKRTLTNFNDGKAVNPSLQGAYRDLLKAIKVDSKLSPARKEQRLSRIDRAITRAMNEKAQANAMAVAKTETLNNINEAKILRGLENPDFQFIQSVTTGRNPCAFCIMIERMGPQPIKQAIIPQHHTNCNCSVRNIFDIEEGIVLTKSAYNAKFRKLAKETTEKEGKIYTNKVWKGVIPKPVNLKTFNYYTDEVMKV